MRLTVLHERIAHKKLSEEQIKAMEAEILNTLQFNLLGTSPYDIAMQTLTLAGYQEKFSSEEFEYAHKICVYLCKMALYDYDFNKTSTYSLLAASIIYIIFKIFQQINVEFIAEQNVTYKTTFKEAKPIITCNFVNLDQDHLASVEDLLKGLSVLKYSDSPSREELRTILP